MPGAMANFLSASENALASFIRGAEQICGYPSEDVRLLADTALKVKDKVSQLGLDPSDTTSQELYYALRARAEKDSQLFAKHYSAGYTRELFNYCAGNERALALKPTVARRLLKSLPPKQTMKKLNYRSVDSLLKRQDPSAVLAAALTSESALWRQKFSRQLKSVTANDFEDKKVELISLDNRLLKPASKAVEPAFLAAAVVINERNLKENAGLGLVLALLETAEKVQDWSFHAQARLLDSGFSKYIAQNYNSEPGTQVGGLQVCFSKLAPGYRSPIEKLAAVSLPLAWWRDNGQLAGAAKTKPVSLSLSDISADSLENNGYRARHTAGFNQAFWHELLIRYLKHPAFEQSLTAQLRPEMVLAGQDGAASPAGDKLLLGVA